MAKKPLRSQLNQIRAWVRQGRTDAWIAHQLDVSASELREFRRRHELSPEEEDVGEVELRDEIEAEIEALSEATEEEEEPAPDEAEETPEAEEPAEGEPTGGRRRRREQLRRRAANRSRARRIQRTEQRGNVGFGVLMIALTLTVVVVTVVMFETLAWLMG
jgi:hypothetical protein